MNYYTLDTALYNVSSYANFEEYAESTFLVDYTESDFYHDIERGAYSEITCGTYNGATQTFTTILNAINESDFRNIYAEDEDIERIRTYTNADWVEDFCSFNDVFTIGNNVYINE